MRVSCRIAKSGAKYLNNRIEADHGPPDQAIVPATLGFKSMKTAYATTWRRSPDGNALNLSR